MPFKSKSQRRKFYALKKRGKMSQKKIDEWESKTPSGIPERVKKHAYFEGHRQALMKLGLDADSFAEFAEQDDTQDMLPNSPTGDDELEEENPWIASNRELVHPTSPWAGAPMVTTERSADI